MKRHQRDGAALVEFAIMLPVFVTILLGCIDFGRFAYMYIAVTNGARAGAEFAAMRPVTPATMPIWQQGITDAVTDELSNNTGFNAGALVVPAPTITTDPLNLKRVRVEVRHPFQTIVPWPGIPSNLTLTRAVEIRVIR